MAVCCMSLFGKVRFDRSPFLIIYLDAPTVRADRDGLASKTPLIQVDRQYRSKAKNKGDNAVYRSGPPVGGRSGNASKTRRHVCYLAQPDSCHDEKNTAYLP